jgi:anti-sigma regulatory factor (Ser/Thr protein kinase)
MNAAHEPVLSLTLAHELAALADAQARLGAFLGAAGCDARTLFRVELVVEELVMNVIRHAAPARPDEPILLSAAVAEGRVRLALEDCGPEFDPMRFVPVPMPRLLDNDEAGGYGLRIVQKMAGAVRYTRTPAGRNRLELEIGPQ